MNHPRSRPDPRGLIRPCDLTAQGLPRVALARLGGGHYGLPDRPVSKHASLAEVARKHPQAIVCLLSALRFHDLTIQSAFKDRRGLLQVPQQDRPRRGVRSAEECAAKRRASTDELWRYVKIWRIASVMRSYMESVV